MGSGEVTQYPDVYVYMYVGTACRGERERRRNGPPAHCVWARLTWRPCGSHLNRSLSDIISVAWWFHARNHSREQLFSSDFHYKTKCIDAKRTEVISHHKTRIVGADISRSSVPHVHEARKLKTRASLLISLWGISKIPTHIHTCIYVHPKVIRMIWG